MSVTNSSAVLKTATLFLKQRQLWKQVVFFQLLLVHSNKGSSLIFCFHFAKYIEIHIEDWISSKALFLLLLFKYYNILINESHSSYNEIPDFNSFEDF